MATMGRFAPWIYRFVLAAVMVIFAMIGFRYIVNPVGSAAAQGMQLPSALGTTTMRVAAGAFPLAISICCLLCLLSPKRMRMGVALIAIVVSAVIAVRVLGLIRDGPAPASTRLFAPEGVIVALCAVGYWLDRQNAVGQGD